MNEQQGARLDRFLRARLGYTGRSLVERLAPAGISKTTLYGWFRGDRTPDLDALARVAEYVADETGQPCRTWELVAAMEDAVAIEPDGDMLRKALGTVLDDAIARGTIVPGPAYRPKAR